MKKRSYCVSSGFLPRSAFKFSSTRLRITSKASFCDLVAISASSRILASAVEGATRQFGAVLQRGLVLGVFDGALHRILQDFALPAHKVLPAFEGDAVCFSQRFDVLVFALEN